MTDHDAEYDELVAMLERAGLAQRYVDEDGKEAIRLTPDGARVGRMLAMIENHDQRDAVLDALLGEE